MVSEDRRRDSNAIGGTLSAAIDGRLSKRGSLDPVPESLRIDGKVCLITGANSGLGKAVAVDLARRGGTVLMACRGGHPEAGEDVKRRSGSGDVEMLRVDLSDLDSVHELCDALKRRGRRIDVAVCNAGLMPRTARRSPQGHELMFAVHFLANRLLIRRLLDDGLIQPCESDAATPRIVIVASEAHRSAGPINFENFGAFTDYGVKDGLQYYAYSKLHLCTLARELDRRLNSNGKVRVAVHSLCPGPVATNIAREAPVFLKPLLKPLMRLLFLSPARAARPVIYLCCSKEMGRRSGAYLHVMREKPMSSLALDEEAGAMLWQASAELLGTRASSPRRGHDGLGSGSGGGEA